jgi:hypothetical protein
MDSEKNIEDEINGSFSLQTLFHYVNENIYGLLMLLLVFFIIYFVDYISRINALMFAMPSPIPGMPTPSNITPIKLPDGNKIRKLKKLKKR